MTDEERDKLLEQAVNRLVEHFDTVEVFVTRVDAESNTTQAANRGAGNWYARHGQISEWITTQRCRTAEQVRKESRDSDE